MTHGFKQNGEFYYDYIIFPFIHSSEPTAICLPPALFYTILYKVTKYILSLTSSRSSYYVNSSAVLNTFAHTLLSLSCHNILKLSLSLSPWLKPDPKFHSQTNGSASTPIIQARSTVIFGFSLSSIPHIQSQSPINPL